MPAPEAEFLDLVHENAARLRKIARVYTESAEGQRDLYQDILVALWRALPSFNGEAQRSTWLYRVALNTALSHERKRAVRSKATLSDDHPLWMDGLPTPGAGLEQKERLDRLYAAIDRLDTMDKTLVMMYLDDASYAVMADVLGISENYVGVKLHRIKKQLATWLEDTLT
ncbi:RNA polymerase subunit sigma-70 [Longimonas halophila]|uniref:RNA polymerase subunit sigma-70 n=1 Tax=Longimonas halophila TaxID=1469170 RepID=A0A2H3NQ56_9BACT|nr:sigma-70 family RNA polymerase sigma factor [Longimonas halophila]PEN09401.1 RNA polymerase subunit sigma-70 [Longimonas halophila]